MHQQAPLVHSGGAQFAEEDKLLKNKCYSYGDGGNQMSLSDEEIGRGAGHQRRKRAICCDQVPMAIDGQRGIGLMGAKQGFNRLARRAERRIVERAFLEDGRKAGRQMHAAGFLAVDRWHYSWSFPFYVTAIVYACGALAWLAIDPTVPLRQAASGEADRSAAPLATPSTK